jgi:SAM-dependent methyltransferase
MTACPLCRAAAPPPFLVRSRVPVHQNLPLATAAEARAAPTGRLEMVACEHCGFVFNRAFDPALPRYGPGYDNTQSLSPAFDAHLSERARHLVEARGVRGARIVEVGCGGGEFLRRLVGWPGGGNTGVGFDPAHTGPAEELGGRLRFERRFFGADSAGIAADVVVCRHVIEHVADPLALLAAVGAALCGSPATKVFFETPDVGWILRNEVAWDFFYEHCSLFTAASLSRAFAGSGFRPRSVQNVFAGQYLWLEATPGHTVPPPPDETALLARRYGQSEPARLALWREHVGGLARIGPVALWGAGAKGVTLAGLIDPAAELIDCLIDINPAKQGRFVPASGHPIVAPSAIVARGVRGVIPMNPAYRAEIAAMLPADGGVRLAGWETAAAVC